MENKNTITGLLIYSDASPRAIISSLDEEKITTITIYHDSVYGEHYGFTKTIPTTKDKGIFIIGYITKPCSNLFNEDTYGLKKLKSEIKINNNIIQYPKAIIPALRPIFEIMKEKNFNFIATTTRHNINELIGHYINGKTHTNKDSESGLIGLIKDNLPT